ncbi:TPA: hypothetical protein HA249_03010 [Candidatus Woesearchaeota archaeon]|nr:hypothetical protein [Candidatus Woesearchaeota archaeon]HIH47271.1 hypothetical protein [Candidatus Woesearchaeota archaeon]HII88700.1 hypothetical protein [Candidatus Woesearchaeota archaeon]
MNQTKQTQANKKAQVTVFIILGLILLILVGVAWYYFSDQTQVEDKQSENYQIKHQVEVYVQECLEQILIPGLYLFGHQGGRFYDDAEFKQPAMFEKNLLTQERVLPYYVIEGQKTMPPLVEMQEQLAHYIEKNLPLCTDWGEFTAQGIVIQEKEPRAQAFIKKDEVTIAVNYPVQIITEEGEQLLGALSKTIPLRLGTILEIAEKMSNLIAVEPEKSHLSDFMNLNKAYDVIISIIAYDEESTAYSIYDEKTKLNNKAPFIFWFAVKNTISERQSRSNTAPRIKNLKDFTLKKGVKFEYELEAFDKEGDAVLFVSDNPEIPINPDGIFSFTPQIKGRKAVVIRASDTRGLSTQERAIFYVE